MIKRISLFLGIACTIPLFSAAQVYKAQPFLGSKTLYQSQQLKYTPPPAGYMPVFINHAGRHGSRHLTKPVESTTVYQLLVQADHLNQLTAAGKLLKKKVLLLKNVEDPNLKHISIRGKEEQRGLADRAFANYKNVFTTARPAIHFAYTSEIRTQQTADAYLNELKTKLKRPVTIDSQENNTMLRFYDNLSPYYEAYKQTGKWLKSIAQLKNTVKYNDLADSVTRLFFTASFWQDSVAKKKDKFTTDLFGFITIFYSIQAEIIEAGYKPVDVFMEKFLQQQQLSTLGILDNAEEYFEKGPGYSLDSIQVKIAMPLLADFINTADDYIKNKTVNAQLRFCHAETIAPYASLLGLTGANKVANNPTGIHAAWKSEKIIPLSSNIQWVFYKKKGSEDYLVKFLLNEKEVAADVEGLATTIFPYYYWKDVRRCYLAKMAKNNAYPDTDWIQYLKNLGDH
ncbi:histidine phosphatase family protein [Ferruginibacter profundus]